MVGVFGMLPSEYWKMTPNEIQILIEAKRPKEVGGIREDQLERMHKRREQLIAEGKEVL